MVDVQTQIIINKPITEVAKYASNPDNAPKWYVNIKSIEWKTSKPLEIGTHLAFKAKFLGRNLSYVYEVIELDETILIMKTADGPFPMETTYSWVKLSDSQTEMTLRNRGIPSGFSKLLAPFMEKAMRRANQKDLKKLKQILEEETNGHLRIGDQ